MIKNHDFSKLYEQLLAGERISADQALDLYQNAPWLELARLAQIRREKVNGTERASYGMFRIINYTNVCDIGCSFCSFYVETADDAKAYVLDHKAIFAKIEEAQAKNTQQIFLQGGVHPELPLSYYTELIKAIKQRYEIHIRAFSPVEIAHMATNANLSPTKVIQRLKQAGLDSVPGAGAEILSDRVRKELSPKKCSKGQWASIMIECHNQGLNGSANIVIGSIETDQEIIEHLELVREIQDQTQGFKAFVPWTFQAQTKKFKQRGVAPHQYLKLIALSRLFLDNIDNIEVSVLVLGAEVGKLALHMGANDISSPVLEENVLRSFGVKNEKEAKKLIKDAGFIPFQRDFNYQEV